MSGERVFQPVFHSGGWSAHAIGSPASPVVLKQRVGKPVLRWVPRQALPLLLEQVWFFAPLNLCAFVRASRSRCHTEQGSRTKAQSHKGHCTLPPSEFNLLHRSWLPASPFPLRLSDPKSEISAGVIARICSYSRPGFSGNRLRG